MPAAVTDRFSRPMKDLRVSVTDRCNFRCLYCMPKEIYGEKYEFLPKRELLTFEEIARVARIFVGLGVTKIRLTGGEPLVRSELEHLVALLSGIEGIEDLTLTTNGYLLAEKAQALKDAGLQRITLSLDTLDEEIFKQLNGRGYSIGRVLAAIKKAEEVGLRPIKINAVVIKGVNDHTLVDLARFFKGTGHIVRFIEYMDVGNLNQWKMDQVVPADEIVERIHAQMPLEPIGANYKGEVALRYRYRDGGGEVGIIASVTKPFCGDCTRVRLSAEGEVYTCLFATHGTDLKDPLRRGASDDELRELITGIWRSREDQYSELRTLETRAAAGPKKVEMYQIGG
ncbi:MAG: GTP 3',8-cyclase MoaA [Nitrospinota bacterium]